MNKVADDILMHYGMPRRSGRYPWGSGEDPYQRTRDFLGRIEELKKTGWTETPENIKKEFGLTTTEYRAEKSLAKSERRALQVATAKSMRDDGLGATEIGRRLGVRESTVRSWFDEKSEARMNKARETADFLKKQIEEKGMIDVGAGVEHRLNISKEKLNQALKLLEEEGYPIYKGGIPQVTNPGKQINQKVICPPGTEHKEIYDYNRVHTIDDYVSHDNGKTFKKFVYPESFDSKRMMVRYAEDGGIDRDGIIELRRGVEDISLGNDHYSQVRILVDGTHYLKGMAVYSDDMPDGVDVIFNTNKHKGTPALGPKNDTVLKPIKKDDPDNPFGSAIKAGGQSYWTDKDGKEHLRVINKRAEEGDWSEWKNALPSQFLAKQSLAMVKKQLGEAKADKLAEYSDICDLVNPTVKKHLLSKFADECDSAAVHLKAAALPGQKYHVIIPINTLKENEIYAPNYENGTKLALIRYPHGGTFEIPILTVNNKHAAAKKLIGTDTIDAVGITKSNADRLSGADFDGDTVMCIPTHDSKGRVKVTSTPPLRGLEGFDPKDKYGAASTSIDADGKAHYYNAAGVEYRTMKNTGTQMGVISNLITDMTLAGADDDEVAAAVRHSMVVIDAEKHHLDYKQSELDNNIRALHKKYQGRTTGGASTIISRSKGKVDVPKRQGVPKVNMKDKEWYDPTKPEGALLYKTADKSTYQIPKINKRTGEVTYVTKQYTQKSTRMMETDDAYTLVSEAKHPKEIAYADYANSMKALANQARKEMMTSGKIVYSSTAKQTYQKEVKSLMDKLKEAQSNAPRERVAQRKSNAEVATKLNAIKEELRKANPDATNSELTKLAKKQLDVKKAGQQALEKYRTEVESVARRDRSIKITDREWEAIQAGAISENKLKQILDNTDVDNLRERATPRTSTQLSNAKISRVKSMQAAGHSISEIAKALNVSTSTVSNYLKGERK